jgi:hypothetical protein
LIKITTCCYNYIATISGIYIKTKTLKKGNIMSAPIESKKTIPALSSSKAPEATKKAPVNNSSSSSSSSSSTLSSCKNNTATQTKPAELCLRQKTMNAMRASWKKFAAFMTDLFALLKNALCSWSKPKPAARNEGIEMYGIDRNQKNSQKV